MKIVFESCAEIMTSGFEGNASEFIEACPVVSGFIGGAILGSLLVVGLLIALVFLAGIYVYTSLAWYSIAKKLKYRNAWIAWIPIVRIAMVLSLGGFHWAWIFLIFIPVLGWIALFVLSIIALWRIFEKRKQPGWFSLSLIIPEVGGILYLIALGIVAWSKKK